MSSSIDYCRCHPGCTLRLDDPRHLTMPALSQIGAAPLQTSFVEGNVDYDYFKLMVSDIISWFAFVSKYPRPSNGDSLERMLSDIQSFVDEVPPPCIRSGYSSSTIVACLRAAMNTHNTDITTQAHVNPLTELMTALTTLTPRYTRAVDLSEWNSEVSRRNLGYAKDRRDMFDALNSITVTLPEAPAIYLDWQDPFWQTRLTQVRALLLSRQTGGRNAQTEFTSLSSDIQLAFTRAVFEMQDALEYRKHLIISRPGGDTLHTRSRAIPVTTIGAFLSGEQVPTPQTATPAHSIAESQHEDDDQTITQSIVIQANTGAPPQWPDLQGAFSVYNKDDLMATPITHAEAAVNNAGNRALRTRIDVARLLIITTNHTRTLDAILARVNAITGNQTGPGAGAGPLNPPEINRPAPTTGGAGPPTGGTGIDAPEDERSAPIRMKTIEVPDDSPEEEIVTVQGFIRQDFSSATKSITMTQWLQSDCENYTVVQAAVRTPLTFFALTRLPVSDFMYIEQNDYAGVKRSYMMPRRINPTMFIYGLGPSFQFIVTSSNLFYRAAYDSIANIDTGYETSSNTFIVSTKAIDLNGPDVSSHWPHGLNGNPTVTPPPTGSLPDVSNTEIGRTLANTRTLLRMYAGTSSGIVIQSNVDAHMAENPTTTLTIADVSHVMEAPNVSQTAATSFDDEANELDSWSIRDILGRPVRLSDDVQWNSEAIGSTLFNIQFPNAWNGTNNRFVHFRQMMNMFNMVRMDVVFRLTVNATSMYGGILAMFFDFFDRYTMDGNPMNHISASHFDPVYLDLSKGTTAELTVPFSAVSQYLSRQHGVFTAQFLGSVKVVTMSTLVRAPGTPTVDVKLFAYVQKPEVSVLQHPQDTDFVVPQASIVRSVTSFAHSFLPGMKKVYPLALEDNYELSRKSSCRVEQVADVYGLVASSTWTSSSGSREVITELPVHPMIYHGFTRAVTGPTVGSVINAPRVAHLGRHFCYWNGTLDFKIQVACSNAHSGKLLVVFHPGPTYRAADMDRRTTNPNILLDIKENHEVEFSVPFISPTAWKPTYLGHPFGDIMTCCTGTIRVYNMSAIISGLEPQSSVTVNIYIKPNSNFQYAVPRNGILGRSKYGEALVQGITMTSAKPKIRMNNEDFNDIYKVIRRFVPLGNATVADAVGGIQPPLTGVAGSCVIIPVMPIMPDLIERHAIGVISKGFSFWRGSMNFKIKINSTSNESGFEVMHVPLMGVPESSTPMPFSYGYVLPDDDKALTGAFTGSQTFHPDKDKEWEVTVPFYSMYEWLHIPLKKYAVRKLPMLSTNNGCLVIRPLWKKANYSFTISMSCGDDFEYAAPTAYPVLTKTATNGLGKNHLIKDYPTGTNAQMPNYEIVVESTVHPLSPPFQLRNDLFRSAWNALPLDSPARASKTKFNRHYYKFCELCHCNVFMYLHEERCRPDQTEVEAVKQGLFSNPVPGLQDFLRDLGSTNSLLNNIASKFNNETAEGTAEYFTKIVVESVNRLVAEASLSVRNWFHQMMPSVDWKLFVSTLVAGFAVWSMRDYIDTPIARIVIGSLSAVATHKFISFVIEVFTGDECPISVQQGGALSMPMLMQLCCGVLIYFLNLSKGGAAQRVIKSLGDLGRSFSGIKSGIEAMNVFTEFVQEKLVPELSEKDAVTLRSLMTNALDILDDVTELNLEEMKVRCLTETQIKNKVLKTFDDLSALIKISIVNKAGPNIMQPLTRAMIKMEKLRTEVIAYKGNERYRVDPFHISIFGKPGLGKSALMHQIIQDVNATQGWDENNMTYSRTVDTEYWDGYLGQNAVIYDDLAQVVQDGPCDITELIGIKSNAPYMVHMASITEKGRYFTSKLIVSSTNISMLQNFGGLRDVKAFHRRRDILVEMVRRQENGKDAPFGGGPNDQDHGRFFLLDSLTGARCSEEMTFEDLMVIVLQRTKEHYLTQDALVKRNLTDSRPSTIAQAIVDSRLERTLPGVVVKEVINEKVVERFEIVDAAAQSLFDQATPREQSRFTKMWTCAYNAAWERRDFAMMTSCFSTASKLKICNAMETNDATGLTVPESMILRAKSVSDRVKSNMWKQSIEIKETANRVSLYFQDLWKNQSADTKRNLATSIVGMGVIGLAFAMSQYYTKADGKDRENNEIPINAFAENGTYEYKSKDRRQHAYKTEGKINVFTQRFCDANPIFQQCRDANLDAARKINEYRKLCGKGPVPVIEIEPESGIDDYKTRRVGKKMTFSVEGSDDFRAWAAKHPGVIPYQFELDHSGWFPKLTTKQTKEWQDYVEYQEEHGADPYSYEIAPESGIDDYKTRRSTARRLINVEGIFKTKSAMSADVPQEILDISLDDLESEMKMVQERGEISRKVQTTVMTYEIEADQQAATDPDAANFIDNGLLDNIALIYHPKSTMRMRAIMLEDKFVAVPKHFFVNSQSNWQQGDEFKLRFREKVYIQSFDRKALYLCPKRDLAIYLLSARVTGARSIIKRIATKADHAAFKETSGCLLGLGVNDRGESWVKQRGIPTIKPMLTNDNLKVRYEIGQEKHILHGYRYFADTVNGECGSLLIMNNRYSFAKIIGFHVAASLAKQLAFSELLCQEDLIAGIKALTNSTNYISGGTSISVLDKLYEQGIAVQGGLSPAFDMLHENLDVVAKIHPDLVRSQPSKTSILPSALQGIMDLEPKTEPAILTHRDPRCPKGYDPLIGAINKFGNVVKPFPAENLRIVQDHMVAKYRKFPGLIGKRLLSLNEAINGIPGVEFADGLNMNSAEGAFWNSERPLFEHNKKWMFGVREVNGREEYHITHKPLLEKIVHRLKEAQAGRRVMSVTQECLKDERRGKNKIYCEKPSTRCFTILPVDYTILVRQYFWDFAAMLMTNRGELTSQVGINPTSIEWTGLAYKLRAMSEKIFAGDYKEYDSGEIAELMDNYCTIINRWYDDGPVNAQVRKVLMQEGYDRFTMVFDALIHIDQGLPSGFPLTALVNSGNNEQYMYLAWLELAPPEMVALTICDLNVDRKAYGDDHVDAVKDKAIGFYNQRTFGQWCESYGITYTDAHKNPWRTAEPYTTLDNVSFLKRLFVPNPECPGFYLAPLEKKSIEDRLLWITNSKHATSDELLSENIKNSMQDAFHWGPIYFNELYDKIFNALKSIDKEQLMAPISFSSEENAWIRTIKGIDEPLPSAVRDIIGL